MTIFTRIYRKLANRCTSCGAKKEDWGTSRQECTKCGRRWYSYL